MPPQVQDLNTLIGQYTSALKPQQDQLDTQIKSNDTSGQVQQQGLDAKKTQAFGDITQSANDRGGYFSGFTPDAQAKYTAATYLPALAQLQNTIASTRSSLLGKKADLNAQANTSALTRQQQEQTDLQKYTEAQAAAAATAAEAEKQRQFEAGQNALNRSAQASLANTKAGSKTMSPADTKAAVQQHISGQLAGSVGKDGHVSNETWAGALQDWQAIGGTPRTFWQTYGQYVNGKYGSSYAGYHER